MAGWVWLVAGWVWLGLAGWLVPGWLGMEHGSGYGTLISTKLESLTMAISHSNLGHLPFTRKGKVGCEALSSLKNPNAFGY